MNELFCENITNENLNVVKFLNVYILKELFKLKQFQEHDKVPGLPCYLYDKATK